MLNPLENLYDDADARIRVHEYLLGVRYLADITIGGFNSGE